MKLFGKKNSGEGGNGAEKRDPRKGKRFFEHAQAVADARNYDYAIECYINGLKHDPDNMNRHEQLYDVALKRKVGGGKGPTLMEKLKVSTGDPVERMLHYEKLWAKDPLNLPLLLNMMERAVIADEQEDDELNLGEVAYWVGMKILEGNQNSRKPKTSDLVRLRDLFQRVGSFKEAVEACKLAIEFATGDQQRDALTNELKDLEAEVTISEGKFEGEARQSVRDAGLQRELQAGDAIIKTDAQVDENLMRFKREFDASPQDIDKLQKYVNALLQKADLAHENQAIELLRKAHEETSQYRFKMMAGDVRIKQFTRQLNDLKKQAAAANDNDDLRQQYVSVRKGQAEFELGEFKERTENYPTDMRIRFEYGKRLFAAKQYEDAIPVFQDAQAEPKVRPHALEHLGSCYVAKSWFDEAIDTFRRAIEGYSIEDDPLALSLRYLLMDALERSARKSQSLEQAREAAKIASFVLQKNIRYRDIRDRHIKLKELAEQLSKDAASKG